MPRSGPVHHNRVEKNVASTWQRSWGYTYGRKRGATRLSPAAQERCIACQSTCGSRRCGGRKRSVYLHFSARVGRVPVMRCEIPMAVSSVVLPPAHARCRLHPANRDHSSDTRSEHQVAGRRSSSNGFSHKRPRFGVTAISASTIASLQRAARDRATSRCAVMPTAT